MDTIFNLVTTQHYTGRTNFRAHVVVITLLLTRDVDKQQLLSETCSCCISKTRSEVIERWVNLNNLEKILANSLVVVYFFKSFLLSSILSLW